MDGQGEWHLSKRLLPRGHEIHIVTWDAIRSPGALLHTLTSGVERDGSFVIHRAARLPNPVGRVKRDYARGSRPNEWLFQRQVHKILAEERFDLLAYGLSHKAVGLPPFDVSVPRVFDYLDLCVYPEVEAAYLRHSDLVLCTSGVLVDRVRGLGGRPQYLPNGVDRVRIASGRSEAVRRELDLVGKPVVATDLAELRRLAFPNVYLAPPEPSAFAAAIVRALNERTSMPDLTAFDWDVLAREFEAACETLVRRTQPVVHRAEPERVLTVQG